MSEPPTQPVIGWVTREYARRNWPDAPNLDVTLDELLLSAHEGCEAYAPKPIPAAVPERYKRAQVLHARALWQAVRRDGDVLGFDDGAAVRVRPLDPTVKSQLRPPTGTASVG